MQHCQNKSKQKGSSSFKNQNIIALQYCVSFCCTATWIINIVNVCTCIMYTHVCTYVYVHPLPLEPLHPRCVPSHTSWSSQGTGLSSLCSVAASCYGYFTHGPRGRVLTPLLLSQFIPPSPSLPEPTPLKKKRQPIIMQWYCEDEIKPNELKYVRSLT